MVTDVKWQVLRPSRGLEMEEAAGAPHGWVLVFTLPKARALSSGHHSQSVHPFRDAAMLLTLHLPTLGFATTPLQLRPRLHPRSAAPPRLEVSDGIEFAEDTLAAVEGHGVLSRTDNCLRVTASDVASVRGTSIDSASVALAGLTAEVPGAGMEVMQQGQILYVFPRDCRRRWRSAAAPRSSALDRMRARVQRSARVGAGWLLLGSGAAVRPLTGGRAVQASGAECFSFLFGDGGADVAALEAAQWQMIAASIRANKGAIVAEQAPPSPRRRAG